MGSYFDAYDRPRPARRADSFTRARDYVHDHDPPPRPSPAAGRASSRQRDGEVKAGAYDDWRPLRRSLDPRDLYPPQPPLAHGRPLRAAASPIRRRHSWPPPPICEDEAVSLAKEAGARDLLKDLREEHVPSRGTVDQEPVVQEVPGVVGHGERRYIIVSDSEKEGTSAGIPTPPTSEDERLQRARRRPSKLNTRFDEDVPELSKRAASPYAFTNPTPPRKNASANGRYLSPDTLTPPPTEHGRRRAPQSLSSNPSALRRDSARKSPVSKYGKDYFSASLSSGESATVDDDYDSADLPTGSQSRPKNIRKRSDALRTSPQTSIVDFASSPSKTPAIRKLDLDARRNTDVAGALPTLSSLNVEKARRSTPLTASTALSDLDDYTIHSAPGTPGMSELRPRSRESSYVSSRGVSPAASVASAISAVSAVSAASAISGVSRVNRSPQRSTRASAEFSQENHGSSPQSGSVSGSRPSSPSPRTPGDSPRLPRTDLDWSSILAANASRRGKPTSRLNQSMRQDSIPSVPHMSRASTAPYKTALPYPVDDGPFSPSVYMPELPPENEPWHFPPANLSFPSTGESTTLPRTVSLAASSSTRPPASVRPVRPPLTSRHSHAADSPASERTKAVQLSSQTRKELASMLKKGLPSCARPDPVSGYDDWYTIIGAPPIAFCPDCTDSVFERTIYRPSIRRLPLLNFNQKIRCVFGASEWMRLAWLLTLQQQRTDLTLLKDVAEVEEISDPCPGSNESLRTWYGVKDPDGLFVREFHICYADVRKLERLLPTLNGFFVPLPSRASYGKYTCSMRANGNRFPAYLDALIRIHEKALASRQPADTMPFIALVERKTKIRECTRDAMMIGALWHFIPNVKELTVCPDCFESVVEPEIRKHRDIPMRFNRTVQPVYGEGMGSSCYLYSHRMRRAFHRATEENDLKYLARKAKERREAELRLQERYKDVMRRAKRLGREGGASEEDERRLNYELQRITEEWREKWE